MAEPTWDGLVQHLTVPDVEPMGLAGYVNAPAGDPWAAQCEAEAASIVDRRILGAARSAALSGQARTDALAASGVPASTRLRAVLEAGGELYYRRDALAGNSQLDDGTTQPRQLRDPHRIAAAIIDPFLGPGIA